MGKAKETLSLVFGGIVVLALVGGLTYGGYWLTKTLSYEIFYKDMVRQEIQDMVKDGALK